MKTNSKTNSSIPQEGIAGYAFIFLISIFLIVIPFYRGLYFRENYIPSIIYISGTFVLYILYKLVKKDYKIFGSYMDIAVLLMPAAYLISFFFSVNARDAFDAVLKYAAYFMIYKIASDLAGNAVYKKVLEYVVVTAMFVMAAVGLICALGYMDLEGVILYNRIYGLYQYSNATASALGAALFLSVGFSLNKGRFYEKLYCNLVLATVFPAFILTFSRGAYVIFAILAVLNILMLDARKRVQYIYSMFTLAVSNVMFLYKYYSSENVNSSLIYLVIGIIVFLALQLLYEKSISKAVEKINAKAVNWVLVSMLAVSVIALVLLLNIRTPVEYKIEHAGGEEKSWKSKVLQVDEISADSGYTVRFHAKSDVQSENGYHIIIKSINANGDQTNILDKNGMVGNEFELIEHKFKTNEDTESILLYIYNYEANSYTVYNDIRIIDSRGSIVKKFDKIKYLPEALVERLSDISLKTRSVSIRTFFIKDGFKIVKDYFLFGTGGGGWKNLYRQYQSLPYDTAEAHNFYLQYALETGALGVAALLAIYYLFARNAFVLFFREKDDRQLPLFIALLMLMIHASMDFNLSLTAFAFLFWMMMGIACALKRGPAEKQFNNAYFRYGLFISAAVILFFSSSIYMGMLQGREAAALIGKDVNRSISLYESAMKKDPFNLNYHMDYAQIMHMRYKNGSDQASLGKMRKSIEKLLKTGLYDTKQSSVLVNLLLSNGHLDEAIGLVNEMVEKNPMVADMYIYKINVNYEIAKQYFSNKEHNKAIPYLNNMLEAEKQFIDANARAAEPMKVPDKMDGMIKLAKNWLDIAESRQ